MNGLPGNDDSRISRRDLFKSAGFAGAALLLPVGPWLTSHATKKDEPTVPGHLWFEHETLPDTYTAYQYELQKDGVLWLEYDDGHMHAFAPDEWKLEAEEGAHRLWLQEADEHAYGYSCLTESEANEQLEDVA